MQRSSRLLLVPLTAFGLAVAGCGSSKDSGSSATTAAPATTATTAAPVTTTTPPVSGNITVLAATSLKAAFTEIGTAFTAANPQSKVTFSFDGSSTLVTQIVQGAPADMFASADQANMDKVTGPGLNSTTPTIFATNLLTIIVPKGNPKKITGVADLADGKGNKVVLCADGVPCGTYARQILTSAGVTVTPVSNEQNVGGVVTKVTTGEADAGIVYVTDVKAVPDKADSVAIPANINVVAKYPIAALKTSTQPQVDAAFTSFLLAPAGQTILAKYGFTGP
jgi:molybdate transport system substrate-binding protein